MTPSLLLTATLPLLFAGASTGPAPDVLAENVEASMAKLRIPGAVIGIVRGGELVEQRAFGYASLELEQKMTTEHLFQIGSVTKPFTAGLAALLIEDGVLDPDAAIGPWFPEDVDLPEPIRNLTVRQLASHTSGLPREPINRRDLPDSPGVMLPYSTQELYAGLSRTQLDGEPGERWSYSNLGYAILGHVVERAAKEEYEALLARNILRPLGMGNTGVHPGTEQEADLATHYWPEDAQLVARPRWKMGEIAGFSGVFSCLSDLAAFIGAQYDTSDDALFSEAAREFMHTAVIEVDPTQDRSMACGWFVTSIGAAGTVLGHAGEVDGHSSCVAILPGSKAGLIVLTNLGGDAAQTLCIELMQMVLPQMMLGR